MFMVYK